MRAMAATEPTTGAAIQALEDSSFALSWAAVSGEEVATRLVPLPLPPLRPGKNSVGETPPVVVGTKPGAPKDGWT